MILQNRNKIILPEEKSKDFKNFLLGVKLLISGSEIDIVNLIRNSLPKIDPQPAKILYNASKGDLKFLETIIEKLGLLANKDIIIEFISLLLGQNTLTKALGDKIGVYEENYETLEALLLFIMAITRYDFQIKPKIISEVKGIDNLTKENAKLYREFIDPIRLNLEFSINKLIRTGAIDIRKINVKTEYVSLKRLIEGTINNIDGYMNTDLVLHKNINSLFSKEKIIEIVEIMVEDVSIIWGFDFLKFVSIDHIWKPKAE